MPCGILQRGQGVRRPALVTDAPGAAPALARRASRSHGRSDKRPMQGGVQDREGCAPAGTSHATGGRMLVINEDLLGPEAIADPYTYYGRLREEDPIHWNPLYATWVMTRYDDVVWALRHPEVFSSEIFLRDPHPPLPPILETDQALYEFNTHYLSHWFIRRDAPDHLRMRRVVHSHFNPKYIAGRFRTLVQEVIHALLAEVEDRGCMEVLQDFAAPLPVLVIAQWLGLPQQDREFIRQLSRHLLALDQENPDRNQAVHTAITSLVEYITPLVEERLTRPRDDLLSVRWCTSSLRLIPFPRKPGKMPPGSHHVKGVRHDSTPIFLPDGRLGTPLDIFPTSR